MKKLRVNVPDELYENLKARADDHHHSLSEEVAEILYGAVDQTELHSILELQGLGKDVWAGTDAVAYVARERNSWD